MKSVSANQRSDSEWKVTIGVCVKNSEATLADAIESIIAQDYPHELIELIFVDDGSIDKTFSIISDYVKRIDISARIFRQKWKGLGYSRNLVTKNADSDYILWVDGDMVLPKNHTRKQVTFMNRNPHVGIGKARYQPIFKGSIIAILENIPFVVDDFKNVQMSSKLPGTGGSIYRVAALRQNALFDDSIKGVGEDQEVACRIKSHGWLIERTDAFFLERREEKWSDLWKKYIWYGYGNYSVYCKNKSIFKIYKMIPLTAVLAGFSYLSSAYRLQPRISIILLPLHFFFKSTAWCWGFLKAAFSS